MSGTITAMKLGDAGHLLLAEARRQVWCVRPEFWDSFNRLLALDRLAIAEVPEVAAPARRRAGKTGGASAVAVLALRGVITPRGSLLSALFGGTAGGLDAFRENLRDAALDEDVDAIVLDIDSPGGSSALVEETAAEIRAAREEKPVVAIANTDAGSAAYWLASQASEVVATPSGAAGSIGAYILHVDYSAQNEMIGVKPTFISAGAFKTEGNPEEPLTDEATAHIQAIVDECHAAFVRDVALGRGVSEKTVRRNFGEGRMLTAAMALEAGVVDRIATLEGTVGGLLAGELPAARPAVKVPSDGRANLPDNDEARRDEEPSPVKSPAQVARHEDEALVDKIIASR